MLTSFRNSLFICSAIIAGHFSSFVHASVERFAYEDSVGPLFEKYCVSCHGPDEQENGLRVDTLDRDFVNGRDGETWHDMHDVLILGDMPPEADDQPSNRERQLMIDWITAELEHATAVKRATGGRGVIRRLTRYEYNNTLTDLLGVELDYANDLPPETAPRGGFENDGSIMGMSGMQRVLPQGGSHGI